MFKRGPRVLAMAPVVSLPSGNVEVVSVPLHDALADVPRPVAGDHDELADGEAIGWSIRSSDGTVLRAGLSDRATASRLLGVLAAHGAALPLIVHGPDGNPTGERLG